ncbi:MAG: response regulator transcription factor [Chloroflexota bacterium]
MALEPGTPASAAGAAARPTILLVDDQESIRAAVQKRLETDGFSVITCADGASALLAVGMQQPALVILDVGLPDIDGFELLRALRRTSDVPVVMLTARDEELDRVLGLELGADDYVPKPFSARELSARVRSVLRRARGGSMAGGGAAAGGVAPAATAPEPAAARPDDGERIAYDGLVVDITAREVVRRGKLVETTRREFDVLATLVAAPRRVFSREQLLRAAWDSSSDWQLPSTVTEHIRRLRLKLEDDPEQPQLIQTVRGVGYRFVPPGG